MENRDEAPEMEISLPRSARKARSACLPLTTQGADNGAALGATPSVQSIVKSNAMAHFICTTCGTQYAETAALPDECRICLDERQYVGLSGQSWTTLDQIRRTHWTTIRAMESGLIGIGMEPKFAIGQRALLVQSPQGNVLWDCIPLLDESLVEMLKALGGLTAIAISHPHYYSTMVEWSQAFGCPILVHAADRQWVMRQDCNVTFWDGETKVIGDGLTLVRCGGHFEGGTVLHWRDGAAGRDALLSGDILQIVPDRHWVSFMYSYPNLIPVPASTVQRIVEAVEPFEFDRIYGAWRDMSVEQDAKATVSRSAERYIAAINRPT